MKRFTAADIQAKGAPEGFIGIAYEVDLGEGERGRLTTPPVFLGDLPSTLNTLVDIEGYDAVRDRLRSEQGLVLDDADSMF
jgi:hypothetical protein